MSTSSKIFEGGGLPAALGGLWGKCSFLVWPEKLFPACHKKISATARRKAWPLCGTGGNDTFGWDVFVLFGVGQ